MVGPTFGKDDEASLASEDIASLREFSPRQIA